MRGPTPGPWAVDDDVVVSKSGIAGNIVCERTNFGASKQFWTANARLIAAAPELLEALNSILDCISETRGKDATDAVAKARAVKAKAEGKQ